MESRGRKRARRTGETPLGREDTTRDVAGQREQGEETRERRAANARAEGAPEPETFSGSGKHVEVSVVIDRPRHELYRFWREFSNLPRIMNNLISVTDVGNNHTRWVARGPADKVVEWQAQIINEEPNELIAWRSINDSDVDNAGSVRFLDAPSGGTEVKVTLEYVPPRGTLGTIYTKLFGEDPEQQVREDLQRFKHLMEQGVQ